MFNLIAQYIGFAGEESEPVENDSIMDCAFGEREDDDWTLVDVRNKKENRQPKNGIPFQCFLRYNIPELIAIYPPMDWLLNDFT